MLDGDPKFALLLLHATLQKSADDVAITALHRFIHAFRKALVFSPRLREFLQEAGLQPGAVKRLGYLACKVMAQLSSYPNTPTMFSFRLSIFNLTRSLALAYPRVVDVGCEGKSVLRHTITTVSEILVRASPKRW